MGRLVYCESSALDHVATKFHPLNFRQGFLLSPQQFPALPGVLGPRLVRPSTALHLLELSCDGGDDRQLK
uniref:Uncharacterized protein n=1 Tax=Timema genevievae TaxID=629358 RepID=A0A7R9PNP4_TIMGE|nr:unnamed protein product [Timema genevievae]